MRLGSFAACIVAVGFTACGGSSNSTPTAPPTPVPTPVPAPELIAQGNSVPICAECGLWLYIFPRVTGRVTITVDYTYPDTPVGLWVSPGHCTYEASVAQQCSWIVRSFVNEKPRKVIQTLSAGEHTLVIDNFSKRDETVSFQVVFEAFASAPQGVQAAALPAGRFDDGPHGPSDH
jgi:hypothetical protein